MRTRRVVAVAVSLCAVGAVALAQLVVRPALFSAPGATGSGPAGPIQITYDGTRTTSFDSGWKFRLVNPEDTGDPTGTYGNAALPKASAVDFDDSSWQSVTLPHDWSIDLLPQSKGVSNATGYFQGGLGWYRKTFTLPASAAGRSISLQFDGIYRDSWLFLNGARIGNHAYGYTGFSLDVTAAVHADGVTPNVLAVVVQNEQPSSRWYSGSGITRNVWLTVTDPVHIPRNGVFVTAPNAQREYSSGFVTVHAAIDAVDDTLRGASGKGANVEVAARVVDAQGAVVGGAQSRPFDAGGRPVGTALDVTVPRPHLWSTTDPYLYTLEADVIQGGVTIDRYRCSFGIRWLRFDPDTGLYINGASVKLHGVNLQSSSEESSRGAYRDPVAALATLEVGGSQLEGFDQATLDYQLTVGNTVPEILADAAANGSVTVIPPSAVPGVATIVVTSEDGSATQTYRLQLGSR